MSGLPSAASARTTRPRKIVWVAARDLLDDLALDAGQRVGQHGHAPQPPGHPDAGELVRAGGGEVRGEVPVALSQDVDHVGARLRDRGAGRGGPVEAGQHHRRGHREGRDRARRHAEVALGRAGGHQRDPAGEVSHDVAEGRGVHLRGARRLRCRHEDRSFWAVSCRGTCLSAAHRGGCGRVPSTPGGPPGRGWRWASAGSRNDGGVRQPSAPDQGRLTACVIGRRSS